MKIKEWNDYIEYMRIVTNFDQWLLLLLVTTLKYAVKGNKNYHLFIMIYLIINIKLRLYL